jgi:AcrR family transcriptional regulator
MARMDTCLRVVNALDARMRATPIERVRVTDLCRDAGIARATFYENFPDVFAVATWMWDHLMETTLYQAGVTLDCYEAHLRKFETLREHREFFGNAMRTVSYESICQHGGRMMEEHLETVYEGKAGRALDPFEALELEFFVTGAKHMTRHWVKRGMVEEPEDMARLFTENVPPFLMPYLEAT